jgi:hypothetical protein
MHNGNIYNYIESACPDSGHHLVKVEREVVKRKLRTASGR